MGSHAAKAISPLPDAIHRAAYQGDLRTLLAWLARPESDPRSRNAAGETALAVAVRGLAHRSPYDVDEISGPLVKTLVGAGVPVNAVDNQGRAALHWAVLERPSAVMALLSVGANPNAKGPNGDTPLHTLYLGGTSHPEDRSAVDLMLRAMGASGTTLNAAGQTADELAPASVERAPSLPSASAARPRARCRA